MAFIFCKCRLNPIASRPWYLVGPHRLRHGGVSRPFQQFMIVATASSVRLAQRHDWTCAIAPGLVSHRFCHNALALMGANWWKSPRTRTTARPPNTAVKLLSRFFAVLHCSSMVVISFELTMLISSMISTVLFAHNDLTRCDTPRLRCLHTATSNPVCCMVLPPCWNRHKNFMFSVQNLHTYLGLRPRSPMTSQPSAVPCTVTCAQTTWNLYVPRLTINEVWLLSLLLLSLCMLCYLVNGALYNIFYSVRSGILTTSQYLLRPPRTKEVGRCSPLPWCRITWWKIIETDVSNGHP